MSALLPWKDVVAADPDNNLSCKVATLDIMWDNNCRSCGRTVQVLIYHFLLLERQVKLSVFKVVICT